MSEHPVLECRNLGRTYRDGELEVEVLRDINFSLPSAAKVAVVGASGSGKSTLLNLLGGLDLPSTGQVLMQGRDLAELGEAERCAMRNTQLGFVYQFHHLLGEFSACENVAMPLLIAGKGNSAALKQASELLDQVGMGHRLQHRPAQLSGGERQRVAIARALVMQPACVLMDEPTGNLDSGASEQVLGLIDSLKRDITASFIVVTHDAGIASRMDSVYELRSSGLRLLEPGLAH
jgi:lipoprotein-releasing system ATP-binding protein